MSTNADTLRFFRQMHRYLGIFISPALLFFALTGAMQTLSLHEGSKGSSYKPSTFLATMGQIHKNQTWMLRKPPTAGDKNSPDKPKVDKDSHSTDAAAKASDITPKPPDAPPTALPTGKWKMHWPLKLFFLIVSLGLVLSTLSGIYMAFKYGGSKLVVLLLLIAGAIIPLLLLPF